MKNLLGSVCLGVLLAATHGAAFGQETPASSTVAVTVDNFARVESDGSFATNVKRGRKFRHDRQIAPVDNRPVIHSNQEETS